MQQLRITTRQKQLPTLTTQQPKTSNRQPSIIVIVIFIVIVIITINKINISTNINVNVNTNISDNRKKKKKKKKKEKKKKKKKKKQKGSKNSSKRLLQSEGTNAGNNCPSRQKEHRPKVPVFPSMFSEIHLYYCIPRITAAEGQEQKYKHIILRNRPTYSDSNRYRHI